MKHDVVYILKSDYKDGELLYSLRSVCMNFQFRKIVFVGGCPEGLYPDIHISHMQTGSTKWDRSMSSLKKALECDELTDDIWLFNDDFFVMDQHKSTYETNYFNGTLEKKILDLKKNNPCGSMYINRLERLKGQLVNRGKDTLSFALHVPMLINRGKALELIENTGMDKTMFRTLYGNYYEIPCQYMRDVKVHDLQTIPDTSFISTSDKSFEKGKVGEFLRKYFEKPCIYEKTQADRLRENTKERYSEEGDDFYGKD